MAFLTVAHIQRPSAGWTAAGLVGNGIIDVIFTYDMVSVKKNHGDTCLSVEILVAFVVLDGELKRNAYRVWLYKINVKFDKMRLKCRKISINVVKKYERVRGYRRLLLN